MRKNMRDRFRLFRRNNGIFFLQDNDRIHNFALAFDWLLKPVTPARVAKGRFPRETGDPVG